MEVPRASCAFRKIEVRDLSLWIYISFIITASIERFRRQGCLFRIFWSMWESEIWVDGKVHGKFRGPTSESSSTDVSLHIELRYDLQTSSYQPRTFLSVTITTIHGVLKAWSFVPVMALMIDSIERFLLYPERCRQGWRSAIQQRRSTNSDSPTYDRQYHWSGLNRNRNCPVVSRIEREEGWKIHNQVALLQFANIERASFS